LPDLIKSTKSRETSSLKMDKVEIRTDLESMYRKIKDAISI
jgi:hypothetical protein